MFIKYVGNEDFRRLNAGEIPTLPDEDSFESEEMVWEKGLGHVLEVKDDNLAKALMERVQGFVQADDAELAGHAAALDARQRALEAEAIANMRVANDRGINPLPPAESTDTADDASSVIADDQQLDSSEDDQDA